MIMTISSTPLPCRPVRAVQTCGLVLLSAVWTTASKRPDTRGRLRLAVNVTASTTAETTKAAKRRPRAENVAGDFYVDHTCIGENQICHLLPAQGMNESQYQP